MLIISSVRCPLKTAVLQNQFSVLQDSKFGHPYLYIQNLLIISSSLIASERHLKREHSTTEYLMGMVHSQSPPGLLPKFSSWSLLSLGRYSSYSPLQGRWSTVRVLQDYFPSSLLGPCSVWEDIPRIHHYKVGGPSGLLPKCSFWFLLSLGKYFSRLSIK